MTGRDVSVFVAERYFGFVDGLLHEGTAGLRAQLAHDYSRLAGFSMMLFLLIGTPCMATVAITRRESNRWRWALLQFGGLTVIAYVLSLLAYQLGRLVA